MKNNVLFLSNKMQSVTDPTALPQMWRSIEQWANGLPDPPSGGGLYASLTGPGETTTPGALTQEGGFDVNDSAGDGVDINTTGWMYLTANQGMTVQSNSVYIEASQQTHPGVGMYLYTQGSDLSIDANVGTIQIGANGATGGPVKVFCGSRIQILNGTTGGVPPAAGIYLHDVLGQIRLDGNIVITSSMIFGASTTDRVSFFNKVPVVQQTATDLATLLTAIRNYGLIA